MRLATIGLLLGAVAVGCTRSRPQEQPAQPSSSAGKAAAEPLKPAEEPAKPAVHDPPKAEAGTTSTSSAGATASAPQPTDCAGDVCTHPEGGHDAPGSMAAPDAGSSVMMPPPVCGNLVIDPGEACEPCPSGRIGCVEPLLNGATCGALGLGQGRVLCSATCQLDTSQCTLCGNGKLETGEDCDGAELQGMTCVGLGYTGGSLTCDPVTCRYDTSLCVRPACIRGRWIGCGPSF